MKDRRNSLIRGVVAGSVASVVSTIALVAAAKAEGKSTVQPLNATSHWLNGDAAAEVERADLRHTAVGYATHHVATIFWAMLFELRPERKEGIPFDLARDAVVMSGIAAGVDYLATPKRFTPGWEMVLSKRSMAWTYLALAAGLFVGNAAVSRSAGGGTAVANR